MRWKAVRALGFGTKPPVPGFDLCRNRLDYRAQIHNQPKLRARLVLFVVDDRFGSCADLRDPSA